MDDDQAPGPGLRERKKQAMRGALSWAALQLAVERGVDQVRVEDIAAAAGVSPRTFNNYFPSKYDAICSRVQDRNEDLADAIRERTDEPLWDVIISAAVHQHTHSDGESSRGGKEWRARVRLMLSSTEMQAAYIRQSMQAQRAIAQAVGERTGTDHRHDMYPRLMAASITTAIETATDQWLSSEPAPPLSTLVEEALRLIVAGLPTP
jgi:AcrR family transcriptional regulator